MEKVLSKKIGREYFIDEERTEAFEGLPCFSREEIAIMKTMDLTHEELNLIFDLKSELSVKLTEALAWKKIEEGVAAAPPEKEVLHPPKETHKVYEKTKREELAKYWLAQIRQEIETRKVRT